MALYVHRCPDCRHEFEVVKPMSAIDELESCPECAAFCNPHTRLMQRVGFTGAGDWNTQDFNPGLGCYTKSTKHARQIAKSRGLEEVGNEKLETLHKTFDKQREDTRAARWYDAERDKLYED